MIKHSIALILSALLCTFLFCAADGTKEVFLAESPYSLEAHFSALFLRPTSILDYAAEAPPRPSSQRTRIFDINPDFHFGFDVGFDAVVSGTNTSIAFDWKHLRSAHSAAHNALRENVIGPLFAIGESDYKKARGHVNFKFDEITVTAGQLVHFGDCLQTNLFAGVRFARIRQCLLSRFANTDKSIVRTLEAPSQFMGTGLLIGFSFAYNFLSNLYFTGNASAALLVGSIHNQTDFTAISPTIPPVQSTAVQKRRCTVPTFEDKIALAWYFGIGEARMSIEAGYFITLFINALQSINISNDVITLPKGPDAARVFAHTFHRTASNFALSGPYVTVSLAY